MPYVLAVAALALFAALVVSVVRGRMTVTCCAPPPLEDSAAD